jgi:ubiquinone/menaquinone biosynthesis C-methylase UbiE
VGDAFASLPYADNSFDALVSVQVMQHAKESVIIKAIKEIVRVVKPGGLIFITLCGRCSKGKVRYCLVQTAKKIAPNTYVPTQGNETGLTHFIYNQDLVHKHYKDFKIMDLWRDDKDYYAFVGRNNKSK